MVSTYFTGWDTIHDEAYNNFSKNATEELEASKNSERSARTLLKTIKDEIKAAHQKKTQALTKGITPIPDSLKTYK